VNDSRIESRYLPAAIEALAAFPIRAEEIQLISLSENVTFRIAPRTGRTHYALRLHRPGYNTLTELNSERQWTAALKEAGIAVPESVRTSTGHHFHPIGIGTTGEQRFAGITTWLEGTPLDEVLSQCADPEERKNLFRQIGVLTAMSHNQSTGWKVPPGFRRRTLDVEGLAGDDPHWGRFWEHSALSPPQKSLLQQTRQRVCTALDRYGIEATTFSLIHADLHAENIVYDGKNLAMIDFDDAAYGWHMYDIATALFEERDRADFSDLCRALVDGYREHRPLRERDLRALPLFLLIRGMAVIGWFHQRPEHDGSPYLEKLIDAICAECETFEPNDPG
jgi:Ser/Thr protein kinase RdoA (MazF antagonist)